MTIYSTPPEDLLKEAQREIANLRRQVADLKAQLAQAGEQWEPVVYQVLPGDDPMYIKDGRIYCIDWEAWEGDDDEWPGSNWEVEESVLAAMRHWDFGGDALIMRRVAQAQEEE